MNRLKDETSPYLLQHSKNPVDWYPWGDEALDAAGMMGKPILLSIGYSACHWCHVMERESFTDEAVAMKMNTGFINIKVDREERPDLDNIYMQAVQSITGRGGWPMTVFLLPDGRPFFGGTYFPPEPRMGLPSFSQVLDSVMNAYKFRRREVEQAAMNIVNTLQGGLKTLSRDGDPLSDRLLHGSYEVIEKNFDYENGGITGAPKFPNPMTLEYLLRYHKITGNTESLEMVLLTLDRMRRGGIYDQAGGGFHRYSVDDKWLVPHFEKMLYDNALLSRLYLHAWQASGKDLFKRTAVEVYDYILREMTSPEGGFFSSTDADSEGVEGKFFIWDKEEVKKILGGDYEFASALWGLSEGPNFEGANILYMPIDETRLEEMFNLSGLELFNKIDGLKKILRNARNSRIQPGCDGKIIASWTGMTAASLAEASRVFGRGDYREAAVRAGNFILDNMSSWEGRLFHTYKNGTKKINGFLEDYGNVIDAFIELYQATYDEIWISWSFKLADYAVRHFGSKDGNFFDTGDKDEELFLRPRNLEDNAVPSGNSIMAKQLLRLWGYSGERRYIDAALNILRSLAPMMEKHPVHFGGALNAASLAIHGLSQAVIIGDPADEETAEIMGLISGGYRPGLITAVSSENMDAGNIIPILRNRKRESGGAALYLCSGSNCSLPVTGIDEIKKAIAKL